jgi:pantoate--beta-alanine ligase
MKVLRSEPSIRVDYVEICDPRTLQEIDQIGTEAVIALAAYAGRIRLIDNFVYRPTRK